MYIFFFFFLRGGALGQRIQTGNMPGSALLNLLVAIALLGDESWRRVILHHCHYIRETWSCSPICCCWYRIGKEENLTIHPSILHPSFVREHIDSSASAPDWLSIEICSLAHVICLPIRKQVQLGRSPVAPPGLGHIHIVSFHQISSLN